MTDKLRVMLVFDDAAASARLADLEHCDIVAAVPADQSLQAAAERYRPELVLIDCGAADDRLLLRIAELRRARPLPVAMRALPADAHRVRQWIDAGVDGLVPPGLRGRELRALLDQAVLGHRRHQALCRELERAHERLDERKLVERAKGVLMQRKGLDEAAAYRLLRSTAMQRQQRIGEVAENLIAASQVLAD